MTDDWDLPGTGAFQVDLDALQSPAVAPPRPTLTAMSGVRDGMVYALQTPTVIGRHPECAIALPEPGVSRQHARLEEEGGEWKLVDLDSTNGTFLNRSRVYGEMPLKEGDQLVVGPSIFRFTFMDALQADFHQRQYESVTRDALTGCFSKRFLLEHMGTDLAFALRHHETISAAMIDIDHFKKLNDTYGHAAGDLVLGRVGALLLEQVRREDVVARFGGEEFVLVMRDTPADVGQLVAERIRAKIASSSWVWQQQTLNVTVSIGIAQAPNAHIETPEQLLSQADAMLYKAKASGRNAVIYEEESP